VPGQDGAQAKSLGQTARLYVRPVIGAVPATPQPPKPEEPEDDKSTDGTPTEVAAAAIAEQRKLRQAPGDASQQQLEALQQYMSKIDCSPTANDPLLGNDKPDEYLVACSTDGKEVYLLGPQIIDGRDIKDAA